MAKKKDNKRAEKRYSARIKVELISKSEECEEKGGGPREAFTTDLSFSGMGLYSDCCVEAGDTVEIFLKHVYEEPIRATVKWYAKQADDLYRLGVKFLNPPSAKLAPINSN